MPEPEVLLNNYGLVDGLKLSGYVLNNPSATHESIHRYQEYRYSIILIFVNQGKGSYQDLYYQLIDIISQQKDIKAIRNYYHCSFEPINDGDVEQTSNNDIIFYLTAHAYRK